jgi:hypothetical protein
MYLKQQKFTACKASVCSLTLALFFCGCAVAQNGPPKPDCLVPGKAAKHIDILVDANSQPKFAGGNACPGKAGAKDGDICMSINEKPDIKFTKTGDDKDKWEFVEFQLSGNGVDWPGVLPAGVYSDFEFGSDTALQTGRPYWTVNGHYMHVQNNNCHEFTVHYRLILKNGTTDEVVVLHPVMDNTGTQIWP